MNIMTISHEVLTPIDNDRVAKFLELCGRVSYKSEPKMTDTSFFSFIQSRLRDGHESIIEHFSITVHIICDRGVSHELVRHRIGSFTQESTRFCDYEGNGINVIQPPLRSDAALTEWVEAIQDAEYHYNRLRAMGEPPQIARSVLPNALKTEVITTFNIRQWRHVLRQRTGVYAHPQMQELMNGILKTFKDKLPLFFSDM